MHAVHDTDVPIHAEVVEWKVVNTWSGVLWAWATNTLPIGHRARLTAADLAAAGEWVSLKVESNTGCATGQIKKMCSFVYFPKTPDFGQPPWFIDVYSCLFVFSDILALLREGFGVSCCAASSIFMNLGVVNCGPCKAKWSYTYSSTT